MITFNCIEVENVNNLYFCTTGKIKFKLGPTRLWGFGLADHNTNIKKYLGSSSELVGDERKTKVFHGFVKLNFAPWLA